MKPQEIFNLALTRVLEQGKPAYDSTTGCQYLKEDGSRCAVGLLLPVELAGEWTYKEVGSVDEVYFYQTEYPETVTYEVPTWVVDHYELLEHIQVAHDRSAMETWLDADLTLWRENFINRMQGVSRTFKLKFPELERTEPEHI